MSWLDRKQIHVKFRSRLHIWFRLKISITKSMRLSFTTCTRCRWSQISLLPTNSDEGTQLRWTSVGLCVPPLIWIVVKSVYVSYVTIFEFNEMKAKKAKNDTDSLNFTLECEFFEILTCRLYTPESRDWITFWRWMHNICISLVFHLPQIVLVLVHRFE